MYEAGPGQRVTDTEMQRMIADYQHDGATVEYVYLPHASGYLVHLPADPDRFYAHLTG